MSDDRSPSGHTDLHPADHADGPGPGPAGPPPGGTVVVGVDGSAASAAALGWALRHAAATQGTVLAVTVWHEPVQTSAIGAVGQRTRRSDAETLLDDAVRAAGEGVSVDRAVERGRPETVLVQRSGQADLLVLGNRRRGPVTSAGSVVQECLRNAVCPVVVVPVG